MADIIEDKEVGELWREWSVVENYPAWTEAKPICDLIRKLVDDRVGKYQIPHLCLTKKHRLEYALRDFGIDPSTWPTT